MLKNHIILGENGIGKEYVILKMSKNEYGEFNNWCDKNDEKINVLYSQKTVTLIYCSKGIYQKFKKLTEN